MANFEFDLSKSKLNEAKHGINFTRAQRIWDDPQLIELIPADSSGEPRWLALGEIDGTLWTAAYTFRNAVIRLISVRRSREEEKEAYYGS